MKLGSDKAKLSASGSRWTTEPLFQLDQPLLPFHFFSFFHSSFSFQSNVVFQFSIRTRTQRNKGRDKSIERFDYRLYSHPFQSFTLVKQNRRLPLTPFIRTINFLLYSLFLTSNQNPESLFLLFSLRVRFLGFFTSYELGDMREEKMAKRSIGSLMRKKLSDITNSQPQPKLPTVEENLLQNFPTNNDSVEQLLKVQFFCCSVCFPFDCSLPFPSFLHPIIFWCRKESRCCNSLKKESILW